MLTKFVPAFPVLALTLAVIAGFAQESTPV